MITLIIKNQLISCYTHLALLTQDQQMWHPLPKNWSSKFGRIWNGKSNIHLFPYPLIWRWETLLSCWRNSHGLSSREERNSCLPRGEKQGCSQEYGTADQHPLQMPPHCLPRCWRGWAVQAEFILSDSIITPLSAHSSWNLQFLCSGGHVSNVPSLSNCEIIMVGDFNLNWMEKCHTAVDSFAMDFHLTKLISQPTRLNLRVVIIHY